MKALSGTLTATTRSMLKNYIITSYLCGNLKNKPLLKTKIMNLEKIAEEIKLELHDKHMMYIDGEDQVTHRWCKQIIWRVLKSHFNKHTETNLS